MRMLLMLNNYFHDMAVAIVAVGCLAMFLFIRMAQKRDRDTMVMVLAIYPKVAVFMVWTASFVLVAGFVRLWNFGTFELSNAVENNQVEALIVKYIMLTVLFFGGMLFWFFTSKKAREMRSKLHEPVFV